MSNYPEHAKMQAAQERTQAVGDFLEWCEYEQGVQLMCVDDGRPYGVDVIALIAKWVGVDLAKIGEEKRAMFDELRNSQRRS